MAENQSPAKPKTSWPDLVGQTYESAAEAIKKDIPDLKVSKVTPGQPMTRDYRTDRVRIMVDDSDVVIQTPNVG
ncbi:hypothetical protein ACOMHN_014189 [Nucella lapillus]